MGTRDSPTVHSLTAALSSPPAIDLAPWRDAEQRGSLTVQPKEEERLSGHVCGHCKGQKQWVSTQNGAEAFPSLARLAPVPHLRALDHPSDQPCPWEPTLPQGGQRADSILPALTSGSSTCQCTEACPSCLWQAGEASRSVPGVPCLQRAVGMHGLGEAVGLEAAARSVCWGGQERTSSLRAPCTPACPKAG